MAGTLSAKVAFISGAGSGIGRASAELFAAEGAQLIAVDIDGAALAETVSKIQQQGYGAEARECDVTDEGAVKQLIGDILAKYGRLDCAFNNVGVMGQPAALGDTSLADWQRVLTVNLTSVFLCMKYQIPPMQQQGHGAIVNTASGAGVVGMATLSPYSASKHGVLGLTKSAALEYATSHIRVNAICPGTTDTPFLRAGINGDKATEDYLRSSLTSDGQFGQPMQVAEAALWLCSDRASWVSGESMFVDGGFVCR